MAHYEVLDDPAEAEVALVVNHTIQAHGVGTLLLEHLVSLARERGVRRFAAEVLAEKILRWYVCRRRPCQMSLSSAGAGGYGDCW